MKFNFVTPLNANRILEVSDTGTVLISDIPFKCPYLKLNL